MFSTEDTIVAIATPPGRGGLGVVRISGPAARSIASCLARRRTFAPRHATLAHLVNELGEAIDETIVTFFPAPHSYTGEDVVELSAHGSPVVLDAIVRAALAAGARVANPGEFTLRAYLNGRIDLVQAEAVGDLIDAVTPLQARVAFDQLQGTLTSRLAVMEARLLDLIARLEASLDFPDEGYHFITPEESSREIGAIVAALDALLADAKRGRMIREGLTAVVVGRPNAGKSSLFNRLAGSERAIVTEIPGTTRDLLTERVDIGGVPFTLVDTAGVRGQAADAIEEEGIARARQARDVADVLIVVLDGSVPLAEADHELLATTAGQPRVVVASKADLEARWTASDLGATPVSSLTDLGIDRVRDEMLRAAGTEPRRDSTAILNIRHTALLGRAREAAARARDAALQRVAEEFVLADLHEARACFDEVTGARTPDDVLRVIFERFCIGK
jgi:tRNA modification GTPase